MRSNGRLLGSTLKSPISTTGLPWRTHGVTMRATLRICAPLFSSTWEMCVLHTRVCRRRMRVCTHSILRLSVPSGRGSFRTFFQVIRLRVSTALPYSRLP